MVTAENHSCNSALDIDSIGDLLSAIVAEKGVKKHVDVHVVDNNAICELNHRFLGKNKPTNVLSFPAGDDPKRLGEIFVSVEYCMDELAGTGLNLTQLLIFYAIHGFLHLLGYEHIYGGRDEKKMRAEECRLFSLVYPGIDLDMS